MINLLYSVGDKGLGVFYTDINNFFLAQERNEAKERFHKFIKAYIEDHPLSLSYKDFALYYYGLISNIQDDYSSDKYKDVFKFSPILICTGDDFLDLDEYRAQVSSVFKNTIDPDFIRSIVNEQSSIINKKLED